MGIYCTQADLLEYIEDLTIDDPDGLEREIERAQRDLDQRVFTTWPKDPATQLKHIPAELDDLERDELKLACCAQVEYRLEMGPEHFVRAQRFRISRRGTSTEGKLPIIGPKVWGELRGSTLVAQTATVGGRPNRHPRDAGWDELD